VDARNAADAAVYSTEKVLTETAENADSATTAEVRGAVDALKRAMDGEDAGEIRRLTDGLTQASHKLAASMYQNAAGTDPQQGGETTDNARHPGSTGPDDDVVDAEYREVA
jgi:molecular chaperone DnaK